MIAPKSSSEQRVEAQKVPVQVRLEPALYERLKLEAARENRSLNGQLRHLIGQVFGVAA